MLKVVSAMRKTEQDKVYQDSWEEVREGWKFITVNKIPKGKGMSHVVIKGMKNYRQKTS